MTPLTERTSITQFRPRRLGPEALVQDIVAGQIPDLFRPSRHYWAAASIPIGAGIPDLAVVSYNPKVLALANVEVSAAEILAYLRAVGRARLETIADRVGTTPKRLSGRLATLAEVSAIKTRRNTFFVSPPWRRILPEIITVEVKISNWQRAIEQAARNRIFAHLSFVALPEKVAQRIRTQEALVDLGIGLISVPDDGPAAIIRKPRRTRPVVWRYYYQIAAFLARSRPGQCPI